MMPDSRALMVNDSMGEFDEDIISSEVLSTGHSMFSFKGADLALFRVVSICSGMKQRIPSYMHP
jgi:hypothetical protein